MGKYKLSELLNEIQGGRTGTYLVTLDELERVRDTIKEFPGMRYRQRGPSKDGKVAFEYEFDPKRGGAFSIYPFKFNPSNMSEPTDLPFSVAGDIGTAIFYVKRAAKMLDIEAEIFKGNQFQNQNENLEEAKEDKKEGIEITQDQMDKLHKGEMITVTHMDSNGNKIKSKIAFTGKNLKEMTADEFGGDEESVARIAKFQNKSAEQVRQEASDIEYEEIAGAFINKLPPYIDRSKYTKAGLGRIIVDIVYDGDLEKAFEDIKSKTLKEMKSKEEIEKELERMENLEEHVSDDDIRKALNGRDYEIDAYMAALEATGQKFDTIQDYIDDFEEYRADKALQEHFGRFLKDYQ